MTFGVALMMQLAASCAPAIAPETTLAIAHAESRFDALAIGDNSAGNAYTVDSVPEAVALASNLLARGHSIDLGLMQINSANLPRLGMTISDAFNACKSIAAGGRILADAFSGGATPNEAQAALRVALSRYNTGGAERGFLNGYIRRVEASARYLVPALQVTATPPAPVQAPAPPLRAPPEAPTVTEADGEWHAGNTVGVTPPDAEGEWHAAAPSPAPLNPVMPSAQPSHASVVVLQGQPRSNS